MVALKTQDEAGEAFGIYIDHTTYLRFVKVGQAIKLTRLAPHSGSLLAKGILHVGIGCECDLSHLQQSIKRILKRVVMYTNLVYCKVCRTGEHIVNTTDAAPADCQE